jgi:citrate synthase
MNAAALIAALLADLGLSIDEHYYCSLLAFSAGIIPCHIDASNKKEGVFFPLSCQRLHYTGQEARNW